MPSLLAGECSVQKLPRRRGTGDRKRGLTSDKSRVKKHSTSRHSPHLVFVMNDTFFETKDVLIINTFLNTARVCVYPF